MTHPSDHPLQGLVVDWGGVLTSSLAETMTAWCEADGIDYAHYREVIRSMLGEEYEAEARVNPIHALERGEMTVPHFEIELARRLRTTSGFAVSAAGLLERMFARFESAPDMNGLVRRAHAAGLRTALLSNSWGNSYPRDGWDDMFDAVVISGEVGMRKPEPGDLPARRRLSSGCSHRRSSSWTTCHPTSRRPSASAWWASIIAATTRPLPSWRPCSTYPCGGTTPYASEQQGEPGEGVRHHQASSGN